MTTRALVLGGGGITGIAWELGVVHGLAEAGVDLTDADLVVGTSAGSVVGAQLRSELPLRELYERQLLAPDGEQASVFSWLAMLRLVPAFALPGTAEQKRARVGRLALRAQPGDPGERLAVIRRSVPGEQWPDAALTITAVDARSGEFVALDRHGEVDLTRAVSASCAVPLVWPPAAAAGRRYLDGGVRSATNADLAAGHDSVVVLAPLPRSVSKASSIDAQLARTGCSRSVVVVPDQQARADIGRNVLDPARRAASARTGRRQSADVLEKVRAAWE